MAGFNAHVTQLGDVSRVGFEERCVGGVRIHGWIGVMHSAVQNHSAVPVATGTEAFVADVMVPIAPRASTGV